MTQKEQARAAKNFAERWKGHGYEKGEAQSFWIDLLINVFGLQNFVGYITFEKQVQKKGEKKINTNYIDGYIPETQVLIEQKSSDIDLRKPDNQTGLSAYDQALKYKERLLYSQPTKWIVTCNFTEFLIYDMERPLDEPVQIFLKDLERDYYLLQFLVNEKEDHIRKEEEISKKAGDLVGILYKALIKEYENPKEKSFRSLNVLCVRIVFCLYAEDAGLFGTRTAFEDYIKEFPPSLLHIGLKALFEALNTKIEAREESNHTFDPFPYVNGGLFADKDVDIPVFTQEIVDVIVNQCAPFNWSNISPTIFGALFEATLSRDSRRSNGMHYTSIENIHKVIDPLFMDDLLAEFNRIMSIQSKQEKELLEFQKKLGSLKFFDPACGCGNFLTETYLSLRRLENRIISILNKGEKLLGFDDFICVKISQFFGIEINDFAVTVAQTAMWIAESQMYAETENILAQNADFLPLKDKATIVEGNALRMDWETFKPTDETAFPLGGLFSGFSIENYDKRFQYNYIIGNPPFVGYKEKSDRQKKDLKIACITKNGNCIKNTDSLDYVCGWYFKAAKLITDSNNLKVSFVSTNSITQGEQVAIMWEPLFNNYNVSFDFAYKTFGWSSETKDNAKVHCVIIGLSYNKPDKQCKIFNENAIETCTHINPYLYNFPNIWIKSRRDSICAAREITLGVHVFDDHHFIFTQSEKDEFIKQEPASQKYFKQWVSAKDFLYGKYRYYLDLKDCPPNELKAMPHCYERVKLVLDYRKKNKTAQNTLLGTDPFKPKQGWKADCPYIIIPNTSSENRAYLPIDFKDFDTIVSMPDLAIPHGDLYDFGIISSNVHMAWINVVCGRMKSDYRYAHGLVYNNFPWPEPTEKQKNEIEKTAQAIMDARALFPNASLADLHDTVTMPPELRQAHPANDKAVMNAYGFKAKMTETDIVTEHFKMYEKLTTKQPEPKTKGWKKAK